MDADNNEPGPKRRKIRKGTHTCWECKRRKVRCTFASPGDTVCVGCNKRCLKCVSQEYPEEMTSPAAKQRLMGDRILRMEEMVRRLTDQQKSPTGETSHVPVASLATEATPTVAATGPDHVQQRQYPTPSSTDTTSTPSASPSSRPPDDQTARDTLVHASFSVSAPDGKNGHEKLSTELLAAFPSQRDLDLIAVSTRQAYKQLQIIFRSQRDIRERGFWTPEGGLNIIHPPQVHPVLIARQMLAIAIVLQLTNPISPQGKSNQLDMLSESASTLIDRLGETAIKLVAHNDDLLESLEGLQCIMMESVYQGNGGHLRRSWLTWRRCLSLAQLMRIPRQNKIGGHEQPPGTRGSSSSSTGQEREATRATGAAGAEAASLPPPPCGVAKRLSNFALDPQFLWYRLVTTEWFMCLLLGLPQATANAVLPPSEDIFGNIHDAHDGSFPNVNAGLLEYKLSYINSYILKRNEHGPRPEDYETTLKIDKEMQEIAAMLPSRWWLAPTLSRRHVDSSGNANGNTSSHDDGNNSNNNDGNSDDQKQEAVWEVLRLVYQIFYYNLLNQLHLPYMMHQSSTSSSSSSPEQQSRYEYSRIACVSASREVLSRYIIIRNYNHIACCCRFAEFFALMGSLTLILVHIDGHRKTANNLLVHQRLSDRAMTESALESMKLVGDFNEDIVSETGVTLLQQLLDIEAYTAGRKNATDTRGNGGCTTSCDGSNPGSLRICVPYVGMITIAYDGAISKEEHSELPEFLPSLPPLLTSPEYPAYPVPDPSPGTVHDYLADISAHDVSNSAETCQFPTEEQNKLHHNQPQALHPPQVPLLASGLRPTSFTSEHTMQPVSGHQPVTPSNNIGVPLQGPFPQQPGANTYQWPFQGVDLAFFETLMRETAATDRVDWA